MTTLRMMQSPSYPSTMTLDELIVAFRSESFDGEEPYLWSDEEIASYLSDAEREACLRARLIYDESSADVAILAVNSEQSWIELHPVVLRVVRAILESGRCPLAQTDPSELDRMFHGWEAEIGTPRRYFVAGSRLRLIPSPAAADTLHLSVYRMPIASLTTDDPYAEPEIPASHHVGLLRWALYRAYSKRDAEAFDPSRAAIYLNQFEREFGPRPSARASRSHLESRPHFVRAIGF